MAYGLRRPSDELFGSLRSGCSALDTSISSDAFVNLPTDFTTNIYLPLVIADDTIPAYEVVYVVGHATGSNSVTVVRGREKSTARQWSAGAVVRCAPTVRDGIQSLTATTYSGLTDAHVGMRVVDSATSQTKMKTNSQGFQTICAAGSAVGNPFWNVSSTPDMVPILQAGRCFQQTLAGGLINWTLPGGAFPTACLAITTLKTKPGSDAAFNDIADVRQFMSTGGTQTNNGPVIQFAVKDYSDNLLGAGLWVAFSVIAIGV